MVVVQAARLIARLAHKGQKRRGGGDYFEEHVLEVAKRVGNLPIYDPQVVAVAYLHDVVEDTDVTISELYEAGFPRRVVKAVEAITKGPDENYEDFIDRVKKNAIAKLVKYHDMTQNLEDDPTPKQIVKYTKALKILRGDKT